MSVINLMDERLANMIAAGEVVERPASIIKELVENSIDAKASQINIYVIDNGLKEIKVIDNGIGMTKEDAKKAFLRHATSKIKTEYDLERIKTLGFRGEALAAILSVSKITLKTRMKDSTGYFVTYDDSKLIDEGLASLNYGTEIIVNDLFYNTPARLKYIKSEFSERAEIINTFDRLALSHPNIRFSLTMDDKLVKETYGNGDYYSLIQQIYGQNIAQNLIYFEDEFLKIKVKGYLGTPALARSRKKDISIFVNGRYIKNYAITQAIIDGYNTFLMTNKYPLAILQIEMDPYLLDVNVHPQKLEVKFTNESLIKYHVELLVKEALHNSQIKIPKNLQIVKKDLFNNEQTNNYINEENIKYVKEELDFTYDEEPIISNEKIPQFEYVGTLAGTYLIFQNETGMYLIDQHAAEERVNYEYYYHKITNPKIIIKEMFVAKNLNLTKDDFEIIKNNINKFNEIGFKFNENMELIAHPNFILEKDLDKSIDELITQIINNNTLSINKLLDDLAKDKSCKASIKANEPLSRIEIEELIKKLRQTKNPYTCPHGRPTIIHLTFYEIERMFRRVV